MLGLKKKKKVVEQEEPKWESLPDARIYVAHGDSTWGNSIMYKVHDDGTLSVNGWLARAPFPRDRDKLLVRMQSGRWAVYLFRDVRICGNPNDMFMAKAFGPFTYAEERPKTTRCDEFITGMSGFFR